MPADALVLNCSLKSKADQRSRGKEARRAEHRRRESNQNQDHLVVWHDRSIMQAGSLVTKQPWRMIYQRLRRNQRGRYAFPKVFRNRSPTRS